MKKAPATDAERAAAWDELRRIGRTTGHGTPTTWDQGTYVIAQAHRRATSSRASKATREAYEAAREVVDPGAWRFQPRGDHPVTAVWDARKANA